MESLTFYFAICFSSNWRVHFMTVSINLYSVRLKPLLSPGIIESQVLRFFLSHVAWWLQMVKGTSKLQFESWGKNDFLIWKINLRFYFHHTFHSVIESIFASSAAWSGYRTVNSISESLVRFRLIIQRRPISKKRVLLKAKNLRYLPYQWN